MARLRIRWSRFRNRVGVHNAVCWLLAVRLGSCVLMTTVDSVKAAMGSYDMVWKNCQEFVVNVMRAIRVEKEEWPEYPWAIRGRPRTFAENLALGAQGLENIPFGAYNPPWHV